MKTQIRDNSQRRISLRRKIRWYTQLLVTFVLAGVLVLTSFPIVPSIVRASYDAMPHDTGIAQDETRSGEGDPYTPIEIRVVDEHGAAMQHALVYALADDQHLGGSLLRDAEGHPLRTDEQGYMQADGLVDIGDTIFAIAPIQEEEDYVLYHTSGAPSDEGIVAFTVSAPGQQELVVSSDNPLMLFDLDVSIEWDASNDPTYLQQLEFNLKRTSQYLYDITNGQAALGDITISQNSDDWAYSHIVVHASNNLRPFSVQGGIVITETVDPDHSEIIYDIGQIDMGATWNRYGEPGHNLGDDWSVVLAHELGHFLFFQDEVYLGMNDAGLLMAVDECIGSVMGDPYTDMRNTEFIADEGYWNAHCSETLANLTLDRTEWQTIQTWYPWMKTPSEIEPGPHMMPFDLTEVYVYDPITPTNALEDPTFYLDYQDRVIGSSEARAYIVRDDYVVDVGSPLGGQNRVLARGAQPGDELCVYDRARQQYGCEIIEMGDDRLTLEKDANWMPMVQISPVTSTTLDIRVEGIPSGLSLFARLYPEYGTGEPQIALNEADGVYEGTYYLSDVAMVGTIRLWVDEASTEDNPRRETMVSYMIGGNPGRRRGRGADLRGSGGRRRGRGADVREGRRRGRGGDVREGRRRGRGGNIRIRQGSMLSSDGQMFFFNVNPVTFDEGQFYTIQDMAGLPPLPPGRTVIGHGYNMVATPGTPLMDGSISFEYMGKDVVAAGGDEDALTIYFWDGNEWSALQTLRDPYYNLVSAPSQGPGVYVLLSSVEIPILAQGWNLIAYPVKQTRPVRDALLSIEGMYTQVKGYDATNPWNPWRRYIVGLPAWLEPYINNLDELEFGKGYFIYTTDDGTLYLPHDGGASPAAMNADMAAALEGMPQIAPATYFGRVETSNTFAPVAGMSVVARVNDTVCGEGETQEVDGAIIYVVEVAADEADKHSGCGSPGQPVTFEIGGHTMATTASWDNGTARELSLSDTTRVYIPSIVR